MAKKEPASKSSPSEAQSTPTDDRGYEGLLTRLSTLLDDARRRSARAVNAILTAPYWEVGRRIVEFEQGGKARAWYSEARFHPLAVDLTAKHGRGFGWRNLR